VKRLLGLARPIAVCAALALVGHAALLAVALRAGNGGAPAGSPSLPQDRLISVSLKAAPPAPEAPEGAARTPTDVSPLAALAKSATPSKGNTVAEAPAEASEPRFVTPPLVMGMPDAGLPDGGVRVNVLVRAGPDGQPADVVTAVRPTTADSAYAHWTERSLSEARLAPGSAGLLCLQVAFETTFDEPRWTWQPLGGASVERCLSGRLPGTARLLTVR
jgi:hypothetical protein